MPQRFVRVSFTRVENGRVNSRQRGRDFQAKDRQGEGFGVFNLPVQNGVDDAARVLNGNTLAAAVPTGIHQIGLRSGRFHTFHQHFGVLRRVQRQERGAETGGEGWGWRGDATLGTGQLGGKTRQEVVLSLFRRQA
ncbi:hypothetical protein D3C73_1265660 [compost metagenome]